MNKWVSADISFPIIYVFKEDEKDEKKYLTVSWWARRITEVETPSNHFVAA